MKDIRGDISNHSKIDIALEFLNLAVREYSNERNYISVIHLAGASEELFGKILQFNACESAIERARRLVRSWYSISRKDVPKNNEINRHILFVKNGIKHINKLSDLEISFDERKEARETIRRAIENYNKIPGSKVTNDLLKYYQYEKT